MNSRNIKGHLDFPFDIGAILAILLFNCISVIFNDFDYITNNLYLHPFLTCKKSRGMILIQNSQVALAINPHAEGRKVPGFPDGHEGQAPAEE
jgi:hypothetical protein